MSAKTEAYAVVPPIPETAIAAAANIAKNDFFLKYKKINSLLLYLNKIYLNNQ